MTEPDEPEELVKEKEYDFLQIYNETKYLTCRAPATPIYYPPNSGEEEKTSKWFSLRNTIHFIR